MIDATAKIHPTAEIRVTERLSIGEGAIISEGCVIEGRDIEIGREFYMGPRATIGGGSRFEAQSSLKAGHFLHMGEGAFVNTARPVVMGNEVGLGMGTKIFTHGAYLSALDGFPVSFAPVTIGDRVWLPGATVNPGVTIGNDVVVGVGSVVTTSIPNRALVAGVPAKIIAEKRYPRLMDYEKFWKGFLSDWYEMGMDPSPIKADRHTIVVGDTEFDAVLKTIEGPATEFTDRLRDQLRRYGIRFYVSVIDGRYEPW